MRVLFPLIASFAGAQALFSSLHGKRARLDVCAYIRSTVALSNPITGKPITFGEIGKIILFDPSFLLSDRNTELVSVLVDRRVRVYFGDN